MSDNWTKKEIGNLDNEHLIEMLLDAAILFDETGTKTSDRELCWAVSEVLARMSKQ